MQLFGFKTEAVFDLWSIEHFLNGISLASFSAIALKKAASFRRRKNDAQLEARPNLALNFLLVLTLSLLWENAEHYVERGVLPGAWGGRVTEWFAGVEHWSNRLVGDNLMVILGWYVFTKKKNLAWAAKAVSTVWLLLHIFAFPNSMYLHTLIARR